MSDRRFQITDPDRDGTPYVRQDGDWVAGISATGYNNTNWDTAYGWGDHAGLYAPISNDFALTTGDTFTGDIGMGANAIKWATTSADNDADISPKNSYCAIVVDRMTSAGLNVPENPNNANLLISLTSHAATSYGYGKQLYFADNDNLWMRKFTNDVFGTWYRLLSTADDWDHSAVSYALTTGDTFTGNLTLDESVLEVTDGVAGNTHFNWSVGENYITHKAGSFTRFRSFSSPSYTTVMEVDDDGLDVAGDVLPSTDSTFDLGSTSSYWALAYIDDLKIQSTGNITKTSHGNYLYHASTAYDNDQNGQITFGTGAASGGTTGDIHFQYTP